MPKSATVKRKKAKRLYHSAKISDYRFRKVLRCFAQDRSARDTARETGLSINSVASLFHKLRVFFTELKLFSDLYEGKDPSDFEPGMELYERALLEFHFQRVRAKHGLNSPMDEPDYHFAESCWRYHYKVMADQRASDQLPTMMFNHLLELIRLCGPVGKTPVNRRAGYEPS